MDMKAKQVALSRFLPKTGQVTEYRAGDDGTYQAGWWKGKTVADNKTRFIVKGIAAEYVVIDLATGLMWVQDGNALGCNNGNVLSWNDAIDFANALDFAGFTDWRMPNINELTSILNHSLISPIISEPPFANTYSAMYWSSTVSYTPNYCRVCTFNNGHTSQGSLAIDSCRLRCVRGGL